MARYSIEFARSVRKDLRKIAKHEVPRILKAVNGLVSEPRPHDAKKLTGAELYRIRIGNYRLIYEIIDRRLVILVVKIGHRKDVYK